MDPASLGLPAISIFIDGISCCAAALVFSKIGKAKERNAEILKSVTRVHQLKDLAQLLDAERSPLVVAISGRVVSETPIECQMSRLTGVIDDGTYRVRVTGARGATDFVLPAENSTFEESGKRLACETMDNRKSKKAIGFKRIKGVLPVGTSLNVVGEASKDDDGTVRIQRPPKGPFYVSCKTIDEHTTNLVDSSRWCKNWSELLTVFGVSIIATSAIFCELE